MYKGALLHILPWLAVIYGCLLPLPARGADVVVLQSANIGAYNQALQGFQNTLARDVPIRGPKAVSAHSVSSYVLTDAQGPAQLRRDIIRQDPDLLLVIGSSSLSLVKGITDFPIVYLMVPYPEMVIEEQKNITGISMTIPAEKQLQALLKAVPATIGTVGMLYDPKRTGDLVRDARRCAKECKITLLALPVADSREVPATLIKLAEKADWYWMVPDRTVLTPQTLDYIFLFSLENRIPILTFSKKYLDLGAVIAVSHDFTDLGKQAGELALRILEGEDVAGIAPEPPRKVAVDVNARAAKMLGVEILESTGN